MWEINYSSSQGISLLNFCQDIMAVEQQPTLQDAETAISSGKTAEGERILKQILEGKSNSE